MFNNDLPFFPSGNNGDSQNFGTSSVPDGGTILIPTTDPTLTQEGGFADAKAVGDKFNTVEYQIGDVKRLETINKDSLVEAINEINAKNLVTVSMENASVETDEDGNNVVVAGGVTV